MTKRPTEASSATGIIIGLVDAIITMSILLNEKLAAEAARMKHPDNPDEWEWFSQEVQDALTDLNHNEAVRNLVDRANETAMRIIRDAAVMLKNNP